MRQEKAKMKKKSMIEKFVEKRNLEAKQKSGSPRKALVRGSTINNGDLSLKQRASQTSNQGSDLAHSNNPSSIGQIVD